MIVSDASVLLTRLVEKSPTMANYALQVAATDMQREIKSEIAKQSSHKWGRKVVNGRLRLTYGEVTKPYYSRWKKTGAKEHGLSDFVYFRVYPMTHKALVGFLNTKSFTAYDFKSGTMKVFKRVQGTKTKEIGQRMEYGETKKATPGQRALFKFSGLKVPSTIKRLAHPVIRPAFRKARGRMITTIESTYLKQVSVA